MTSYEQFKEMLKLHIKDFLPDTYNQYNLEITTVNKMDETLDSLVLIPNEKETCVMPSIYINYMYEEYLKSQDVNIIFAKTALKIKKSFNTLVQ